MKGIIIAAVAAGAFAASGVAVAQEDLAKASGCLNCHSVDAKKIGPAFKDVATKYKGNPNAETTIVAELRDGKGHMKINAPEANIKAMADYILTLQ